MPATASVIEIPLRNTYAAGHHTMARRRGIIVEAADGAVAGWGEFVEIPGYSPETTETALAALLGEPLTHSNPMAIAARRDADLALEATRRGTPLTTLLGASPGPVASGAVVAHFGDVSGTLEEAAARVAEGYRKIKIKIGPGFDIEPLRSLRRRWPEMLLAADANGAYRPGEIPDGIDGVGLVYLEQPYPAATAWAALTELRSAIKTPICLDESITGLPTLRAAIAARACDIVNVKPARLAGLRQAVALHDVAVQAGLRLVAGGLLETGVGRGTALALARLPGFAFPADLSASDRYWGRDLTVPPWQLEDGRLLVPDRAGLGVDVDRDFLDDITLARHSLPD